MSPEVLTHVPNFAAEPVSVWRLFRARAADTLGPVARYLPRGQSGGNMEARRLIENADFDPTTLAVLSEAFDGGWSEIEAHFKGDDAATRHARMRLAYAILLVARQDDDNADQVKNEALQVVALAARRRVGSRKA
jgi:hypothetical protein